MAYFVIGLQIQYDVYAITVHVTPLCACMSLNLFLNMLFTYWYCIHQPTSLKASTSFWRLVSAHIYRANCMVSSYNVYALLFSSSHL